MKAPLEIMYASTEQGQVNGQEGFGIRYASPGIPYSLLDKLEERGLFYYTAGTLELASVAELIENPKAVNAYPPAYQLLHEELDGKRFRILSKTIYLGRDYGWYLQPSYENARSGNTFTHAFIYAEEEFPWSQLTKLAKHFRPFHAANEANNQELQQLLTGEPNEVKECLWQEGIQQKESEPLPNTSREIELAGLMCAALEAKKSIILKVNSESQINWLNALNRIPSVYQSLISVVTNYQEYQINPVATLLIVNEHFKGTIPQSGTSYWIVDAQDLLLDALLKGKFLSFLSYCLKSSEAEWEAFVTFVNQVFERFSNELRLELLCEAWTALNENATWSHETASAPNQLLAYFVALPIRSAYKHQLKAKVLDLVKEKINKATYTQFIQEYLPLIEEYKLFNDSEFKTEREYIISFIDKNITPFSEEPEGVLYVVWRWYGKKVLSEKIWDWLSHAQKINAQFFKVFLTEYKEQLKASIQKRGVSETLGTLINWNLPTALFQLIVNTATEKNLYESISDFNFFPEVIDPEKYQEYLGGATEQYLAIQINTTKGSDKAQEIINNSFDNRPELKHLYTSWLFQRLYENVRGVKNKINLIKRTPGVFSKEENVWCPQLNSGHLNGFQEDFIAELYWTDAPEDTFEILNAFSNRYRNQLKVTSDANAFTFILEVKKWLDKKERNVKNAPIWREELVDGFCFIARHLKVEDWHNIKVSDLAILMTKTFPAGILDKSSKAEDYPFLKVNDLSNKIHSHSTKVKGLWEGFTIRFLLGLFQIVNRPSNMQSVMGAKKGLKYLIDKWKLQEPHIVERLVTTSKDDDFKKWLIQHDNSHKKFINTKVKKVIGWLKSKKEK